MANFNLGKRKNFVEDNMRYIIQILTGLMASQSTIESQCLLPYDESKTYVRGQICLYNNYLYLCKTTCTGPFDPLKWTKQQDDFDELSKSDIEALLGLTTEELQTMSQLIADSEVRIDKTYSSSKIYTSIQDAIDTSKAYTLSEIGKMSGASYKVVSATSEMTSESIIYLLPNASSNYDMYIVEADGTATRIGDMNIDLSQYFTKVEIEADYLKKVDADRKFTTITTANGLITNLDDYKNELLKIANDTYIEDANNPTSTICKSNGDTLNTPYNEGLTNASIPLLIPATRGTESWNGQLSISMASNNIYIRNKGADGWCVWQKVSVTSAADEPTTLINPTFPSTITSGKTQKIYYSLKNGWASVSIIIELSTSPKLTWTIIAEGLPKPDKEINTSSFGETAVNNASVGFRLKGNGVLEMLVGAEITQSDWWNISFSYPVAES